MLTIVIAAGDWWTDEYNVKPIGVLEPPSVLIEAEEAVGEIEAKKDIEWVVIQGEE
jgi:hypothetical protein